MYYHDTQPHCPIGLSYRQASQLMVSLIYYYTLLTSILQIE